MWTIQCFYLVLVLCGLIQLANAQQSVTMPFVFTPCENARIYWENIGDSPFTLTIYNGSDVDASPIRQFVGIPEAEYNWLVDISVEQITVQIEGSDGESLTMEPRKLIPIRQGPPGGTGVSENSSCISNEAQTVTVSDLPQSTGGASGDDSEDDDDGNASKLLIGGILGILTFLCAFYNTII